jgi:hypothetical protein
MYSISLNSFNKTIVHRINGENSITGFQLDPDNTDYQQFKRDIQNGTELLDASGNAIIGSDLTTFINSLP